MGDREEPPYSILAFFWPVELGLYLRLSRT